MDSKIIKTLLISPPREIPACADFPPIGLCYLAASLRKNKLSVKVVDASSHSWRKVAREILEYNPDLIGITCWTIERKQAYKTSLLAKKVLPQIKIIIGGQHATAFPEHMFIRAKADLVGLGECDETMVELIQALSAGQDIDKVKGIVFKQNGKVIFTPPRLLKENLDDLPFPDYSDFNFKDFNGLPEIADLTAAIITSRGCSYRCIFCSSSNFWEHRWRFRTAGNILTEIENFYQKGIKAFLFFDDNFAAEKERSIKICKGIIERKLNINWAACTRVEHAEDEEILNWMRKANCYRIDFGVESGSPKILKNINKRITPEQTEKVFKACHKIGIKPRAYLMVGNPGETKETIQETIQLMKKIKPYHSHTAQILWILPNTELYGLAKKQDLMHDDWWLKNDETPYYSLEYNLKQLQKLKARLECGLAKNERTPIAYLRYFILRLYFRFSLFQRSYNLLISRRKGLLRLFLK